MGIFTRIEGAFPVVPLMGFPGSRLTNTTVKQNLENDKAHFQSLAALYNMYHPDAMITMMDLSVEAEAIGISVIKPEDESYTVNEHPIQTFEQLQKLIVPNPQKDGRMPYWINVVKKMKIEFECPSMAYLIGPYTLAGLLTGATNVVKNVMKKPDFLQALLEYSSRVISAYGKALIEAGADAIIMLEPTATVLSPRQFNTFSGRYVSKIIDDWEVPTILHICGDTKNIIPEMVKTGCVGISVDSMINMTETINVIPDNILLIGNIDPVKILAYASPEELTVEVNQLLKAMSGRENFVLSSGCDLPPETNLENIALFIKLARI